MSYPRRRRAVIILFAITFGIGLVTLVGLRLAGLLIPYSSPTDSMVPALRKGDQFLMEGITYHFHKPRRGDLVVFTLPDPNQPGVIYVMRLVGLPGETLRISDGKLYVNDKPVTLNNRDGEINFTQKMQFNYLPEGRSFTIPDGHYFVIGDNLEHSADSRVWGPLPAENLMGRVAYIFGPWESAGAPK